MTPTLLPHREKWHVHEAMISAPELSAAAKLLTLWLYNNFEPGGAHRVELMHYFEAVGYCTRPPA